MQKIHSILLTTLLVFSFFSLTTYTSCKEDKCKNITCLNGGGCAEGVCVCPTGYSGTLCQNAPAPDPCANVICQNGGTCDDGTCTCPNGYEGTNCQTLSREKFIGVFTGTEQCTIGNDTYSITVIPHSDNTKFTMANLYNSGYTAICTVTGTNTFTLTGNDGNISYTGSGSISGNQITFSFQITDGVTTNACTYTGTR